MTNLFKPYRGYLRLAASDFLSNYATTLASTTIQLWLLNSLFIGFQQSSHYLSLYLTLTAISELVAGLFSGALAEHVGIFRTTVAACLARMIAGLCIIAIVSVSFSTPSANKLLLFWCVCILVMVTTACDTFYFPAITSFVNRVTKNDDLINVLSLLRFTSLMGTLVGPAVAGFASSKYLYIPILFTETIALAGIIIFIYFIYKHAVRTGIYTSDVADENPEYSQGFLATWARGMATFVKNQTYRTLAPFAILEAIASTGISFAGVLLFSMVLHSAEGYGWYLSAMSLGYALSYLIAPKVSSKMSFSMLLTLSHILVTLSIIGLALAPNAIAAAVFGFLFAFFQGIVNPPFQTVFIHAVDDNLVGQVMSVFISVVAAIGAVSYPLWDYAYSHMTIPSLHAESGIIVIAALIHFILVLICIFDKRLRSIKAE